MSAKYFILFVQLIALVNVGAQEVDPDLIHVRNRLDSIKSFKADIMMDVDISFINMPTKYGKVSYTRGNGTKITSNDFIMLPKRGLDLTMEDIFKYPYITVQRGVQEIGGIRCKVLNIIPTSEKADFSIATLFLDKLNNRILKLEVSTKKDGVYTSFLNYKQRKAILPSSVEVQFEVSNVKIPLRFLGKETKVDKSALKDEEAKTGKILLQLTDMNVIL